jgi:hypothetical protein
MARRAAPFVVVALLFAAPPGTIAADQVILGRQVLVKDPKPGVDPARRKLIGQGKGSGPAIVGDPTQNGGGTITFFVNGGSWTSQTFPLPQGVDPGTGKTFWRGMAAGFTYQDRHGTNGPVRVVQIERSTGGTFRLKAVVLGKLGDVELVPPNPGATACVRLDLAGGDSYHVLLPSVPSSTIGRNDDRAFVIRDATAAGLCPMLPPTTTTSTSTTTSTNATSVCGNGVREPGEQCDGGPACTADCQQTIPSCCGLPGQCISAPLFSLNFYLFQYCGSFLPGSSPFAGDSCQPDGSCTGFTIDSVPLCCQLSGSCYELSESTTEGLWHFQNVCRGSQDGTFFIAATCGSAGFCLPN